MPTYKITSKNRTVFYLMVLGLHLFSLNILSRENDENQLKNMSLEELLSIKLDVASTQAKTVFQTPSTVSVITADMIRMYNFQTIAEAINTVAGFSAIRTGARGMKSQPHVGFYRITTPTRYWSW